MKIPYLTNIVLITTNQVDLGIRALSGVLRDAGCKVRMFFLEYPAAAYPDTMIDQLIDHVRDADLIGISTLAYSHRRTQQLCKALRPLNIPVVLGGLHCTFRPEEAIQDADIICLGEAEETIVDLVCNWTERQNMPGIWVRDAGGDVHRNPRRPLQQGLDKFPMPDLSPERVYYLEGSDIVKDAGRIKATHHHQIGDRTTFVYASDRGCPLACTFCYNHQMRQLYPGQRPLRFKSVDRIMDELHEVVANYPNTRFINFMNDDSFARTESDIAQFARRYGSEIGLPFFMMGTPNTITETRLEALVDAGLSVLNMGIQSGSDRVNREVYGRPCLVDRVLKTARTIHRFTDRITVYYDLIINSPFEKDDDLRATFDLVRALPIPFYLVTHNLVVGEGSYLWDLGRLQGVWEQDEADRIYRSDYHDYENFESRPHVNQYLNHLLEWMAGLHNESRLGRLPRQLAEIDPCSEFRAFLRACNVNPPASGADSTLDFLLDPQTLAAMQRRQTGLAAVTQSLAPKQYWQTPAYQSLNSASSIQG